MANDADIRSLTRKVADLERSVGKLGRVLDALNTNFTEYLRMLKEAQEKVNENPPGQGPSLSDW